VNAPISYAVVTPIFEDTEAATRLMKELRDVLGDGAYIVAVDDGSIRHPVKPDLISGAGLSGAVLRLKRNAGHQRAIATGLGYVADKLPDTPCIVLDSDGEDVPATIPQLTRCLESADIDVAVAQRKSRAETLKFKAFYVLYKLLFRLLTGRSISFGNFMAMKPAAVRRLAVMEELGTHVASAVLLSKLRFALCPIDRGKRYAGQSKMNFAGLVLHGFRALMIFTEDVLVRTGVMCVIIALLSVAGIVASILLKSFGFATPGWFSVALGILVIVLLQTGALTLMTLLLTGVARGANVISTDYKILIDQVLEARAHANAKSALFN
jgi:hypothetical protein